MNLKRKRRRMEKKTLSFEEWSLTAPSIDARSAWKFQESIILGLKETSTRIAALIKEDMRIASDHMIEQEKQIDSLKGQVAQLKKEIKDLS